MKTLPIVTLVLVLLLLGAATLFAEPEAEAEPDLTLGLTGELEVGPELAEALGKALAEKPPWQVRVDATFLRVYAERTDEILGEHRPDVLGSARPIPAKLARQLVSRARGQGAVRPEPLPPLVLHAEQAGRLSATGQHTYLQDFDVEVGGMGDSTVNPLVGRLQDGTRIDVTPRRDDERLLVEVEAVWAEVVRPVPLFDTTLASPHAEVTIELPELRMFHVRKQTELPAEGGYVLAGGGRAWDGEALRLVVLEVRRAKR